MKRLEGLKQSELINEIKRLEKREEELELYVEELRLVNKVLTENEGCFRAVLNNSMAVVYIKDINDKYLFINKRYEELFHVSLKDIKGKTDYDFHTKIFADKFIANDHEVIELRSFIEFEEEAFQDDGVHSYVSLKFPLFNKDGDVYAVCGISTDITLRKRAEVEREEVIVKLKSALEKVKELNCLIPMCSICRRVRNDSGYWNAVEEYTEQNSNIKFTDGMCPECYKQFCNVVKNKFDAK
jgi:PAS domain S-box-containing protein